MIPKMTWPRLLALAAAALLTAGCVGGDDTETLSTRADQDPVRYQKAQAEAEQAAQRAREAEAKKLKGAVTVEQP